MFCWLEVSHISIAATPATMAPGATARIQAASEAADDLEAAALAVADAVVLLELSSLVLELLELWRLEDVSVALDEELNALLRTVLVL